MRQRGLWERQRGPCKPMKKKETFGRGDERSRFHKISQNEEIRDGRVEERVNK